MSDPLTAIERDAAALAAMTPGPWQLWTGNSWRRFGSNATGQTVIEPVLYSERDRHPDLRVSDADAAGIARLRNRFGLYLRYFRAVEARDAKLLVWDGNSQQRVNEVAAARKAILEDTNGPS